MLKKILPHTIKSTFISIVSVAFLAMICGYVQNDYKQKHEKLLQKERFRLHSHFAIVENMLNSKADQALTMAMAFAENRELKKALAEHNRERVKELTWHFSAAAKAA